MRFPPFSVVIPSLGGKHLVETVDILNSSSIKPDEVILCVPKTALSYLVELHADNIKVVPTDKRGQVAQRLEGFKVISNEVVVQIDDDVHVKEDTLEHLLKSLLVLGKGNTVGPVLYNAYDGRPITSYKSGVLGFMDDFYACFIRGLPWGPKRSGAMSNIGCSSGVDPRYHPVPLLLTSWLPGGCCVSFRDDLILKDFYPFPGKAYSEDLIHSKLRADSRVIHYVALDAGVLIRTAVDIPSLEEVAAELRARVYVAQLLGGCRLRALIAAGADFARRTVIALIIKVIGRMQKA